MGINFVLGPFIIGVYGRKIYVSLPGSTKQILFTKSFLNNERSVLSGIENTC